ncbi:MAG TPA: D-glycero-beta-D-manno-heptose-7-phosphate kinase [Alphaproteobacteria bacterium]|nr:D-glycero-beta-D-manno-heptose-7-phosphate kinase [Alphaproteobacteria bacterium]
MSQDIDLAGWLPALADQPVLCVGDVMLDRFVGGSVDRISPEAPIPVLRVTREAEMIGGAGNVAANLVSLGAQVRFVSVVGDDPAGAQLRRQWAALGGPADGLVVEPGRPTTLKTRFVAGAQQLLRADQETSAPIAPAAEAAVIAAIRAAMGAVRAVVLSDYAKGVLTDAVVRAAIEAAREAGVPLVVDPKGRDYGRYRGASVLTPNRKELAQATGLPVGDDAAVVAAARRLLEDCGVGAVVATRSEQGMTVVSDPRAGHRGGDVAPGGQVVHLPTEAREVADVSGAGDTVVATLALALAAGAPLTAAAQLANRAAGIVVGKLGTATVTPAELRAALHLHDFAVGEAKVLPREAAAALAEQWRRQGLSVGFTNGCFDLVHPGHVSLLRQARAGCDRLVVGLNSDASVRRLKGETRPIQGETSRATVLAALAPVDLVVIFDEDTPLELIRLLRPDVLVKGADYTIDKVVGADVVQSYGGRVLLADLVAGQSTTGMVSRMK